MGITNAPTGHGRGKSPHAHHRLSPPLVTKKHATKSVERESDPPHPTPINAGWTISADPAQRKIKFN